jgi:hypothetical protein
LKGDRAGVRATVLGLAHISKPYGTLVGAALIAALDARPTPR